MREHVAKGTRGTVITLSLEGVVDEFVVPCG